MSDKETARRDYERALGCAHHEARPTEEDDQKVHPILITLMIIALAMTVYGGLQFFLHA